MNHLNVAMQAFAAGATDATFDWPTEEPSAAVVSAPVKALQVTTVPMAQDAPSKVDPGSLAAIVGALVGIGVPPRSDSPSSATGAPARDFEEDYDVEYEDDARQIAAPPARQPPPMVSRRRSSSRDAGDAMMMAAKPAGRSSVDPFHPPIQRPQRAAAKPAAQSPRAAPQGVYRSHPPASSAPHASERRGDSSDLLVAEVGRASSPRQSGRPKTAPFGSRPKPAQELPLMRELAPKREAKPTPPSSPSQPKMPPRSPSQTRMARTPSQQGMVRSPSQQGLMGSPAQPRRRSSDDAALSGYQRNLRAETNMEAMIVQAQSRSTSFRP